MVYQQKSNIFEGDGLFTNKDYRIEEVVLDWSQEREEIDGNKFYSNNEYYDNAIQIGADAWIYHSVAKRINHSCDPNCRVEGRKFIAIKDIRKDEEITYDYSTTENSRWESRFKCLCRNKDCRKNIKSFHMLSKNEQSVLKDSGIVSKWISQS